MALSSQIPSGAEDAVGVAMTYSIISLCCSAMMIWLTRVNREALTYVALVAYFAFIATIASIMQQIHSILKWDELIVEQFRRRVENGNVDSPEAAIANGSFGIDLVLFYIQYYTYNVQSLCILFWAASLAATVYGWNAKPRLRLMWKRIDEMGRIICIFLPLITVTSLQSPGIKNEYINFVLLADLPLMLSLFLGSCTLVAILIRYVQTRKKLTNWSDVANTTVSSEGGETIKTIPSVGTRKSVVSTVQGKKPKGIYDRWLMIRFICSFMLLAIFEVTNTLFQITSINNAQADSIQQRPDGSVDRARAVFFLFMPGVTPGLFLFLVFGTTTGNRRTIRRAFSDIKKKFGRSKKALTKKPSWTRNFLNIRTSIMEISSPTQSPLPLFTRRESRAMETGIARPPPPIPVDTTYISHPQPSHPNRAMSPARANEPTPSSRSQTPYSKRNMSPARTRTAPSTPARSRTPLNKEDLMKPLPTTPAPVAQSLFSQATRVSIHEARAERLLFGGPDDIRPPMHRRTQSSRAESSNRERERINVYYEPQPDHSDQSDDSGPILPIMRGSNVPQIPKRLG